MTLNLFYEEPDPDRWIKFDRYPRRIIRRLIRGRTLPGGVGMVVLNLMAGLDRLHIPYRFNDYKYIRDHPDEIACIIGKPHVLFEREWKNPIIFGPGIYSHPMECPDLFERYPEVKLFLVPGDWMKEMFKPVYGEHVMAWPVGIDTEIWSSDIKKEALYDFLIYDKIRWNHDKLQSSLIGPICSVLRDRGMSYHIITYGEYKPAELSNLLAVSRNVIFLCEHETQGLAYQQILSTGTPILAWEHSGYWQDPYYYPHKVQYSPVSAVPYWDDRCGKKFSDANDFPERLEEFLSARTHFDPASYIRENLSLETCAMQFYHIHEMLLSSLI